MPKLKNLVAIDTYGLLGSNFYWNKGKEIGLSGKALAKVGLEDERIFVDPVIVPALQKVEATLKKNGYRLFIREGYRSKELYELIHEKIKEKLGESEVNKILNMKDMPHATGRSVDVALWKDGQHVVLHDKKDGIKGYFIDFYKDKNLNYQRLQELLIKIMQDNGFRLGTKNEYFHFNYDPKSLRNYP